MKVSLNWLSQYVDISGYSTEVLAEKITNTGVEVDGIESIGEATSNVVVGYVEKCDVHPHADKLKLCQVNVATETLQIVCGAPNVAQGQKVAVAMPGSVLPGGMEVNKVTLRGVESNGMICSLQELGMDDQFIPKEFADGIYVFTDDVHPGDSVDNLLNLGDTVLEFDLTPNRSDCLSMLGVAYEVSAILDRPITFPDETVKTSSKNAEDVMRVDVQDPALNPYYAAYVIQDVVVKPSPLWMRNALMAHGIRPINNVVDITNYVLMEYGQPLHAFDLDRIASEQILTRRAAANEKIMTLDQETRTLSEEDLVITDGQKPIALAGIMGGADTEVHEGTKTILLEAAYFDPLTIRKTVGKTGLRSESSTRFEKGVDPERIDRAALRACHLLEQYAQASILQGAAVYDKLEYQTSTIEVNMEVVNRRLGTSITIDEAEQILERLRFPYKVDGQTFNVSIPSRRGDVRIFEDMLEEMARMHGYDKLPYTLPFGQTETGGLTHRQQLKRDIKGYMEGAGLMETITYSLTDEASTGRLLSPEIAEKDFTPVHLSMPMTTDHEYLRLSILPELMHAFTYNAARQQRDMAFYELGRVFLPRADNATDQPEEQERLSGALTGLWVNHSWQNENRPVDFFVVKGIVEGLFQYLDISVEFKQASLPDMHPGRCAIVMLDGETVGFLGQIHPMLAKDLDLKETYVFDLNMERVLDAFTHNLTYYPVPKYPSISRDAAFVLDQSVAAEEVRKTIFAAGSPLVTDVYVFDVYEGDNLPEGKKSIAYHLLYQDPEKTLQDKEVEASFEQIINTVNETYNAYVRM